ncbi:MAG: ATP-binding protein [Parachlamydia sp.]|nr:ATP-binding protein [Parachlamydia sp.]
MQIIDKSGSFYLGKFFNPSLRKVEETPLQYDARNLTTHAVCLGMTGSGKTGLGIAMLEEAGLNGIPAIAIDPKGDLGNLLLTFPNLIGAEFLPWIDAAEAERKRETPDQYAVEVAKTWKEGLEEWGEGADRIRKFKGAVDASIYTPASQAGIPLSILNSFAAPPAELLLDPGALRDRVLSTTSSLLGLIGVEADPIKSREHILISTIFEQAWREKMSLDLPGLIQQIQKPPFAKVGVLATETFYPEKDRMALAMRLNNLLASPGFQAWMQGEPLDIQSLLYTKEGKPRVTILSIAHLGDSERMFFVTLFLNELLGWMRKQSGTSNLRALVYMDEIFGFFPPTAMPPSKLPMLTLLKQARAFGLGIVLATQNPVDLDYKGLANCGTWFIGKLQTERDRARVIEGLSSASIGEVNAAELHKMIASLGTRVFLLRSIYLKEPQLFQTRWTLSYLRGPLTLPQIQMLMSGKVEARPAPVTPQSGQKPVAPIGVKELFAPSSQPITYVPKVLGMAKLHFVDAKKKIDSWRHVALMSAVGPDGNAIWEESKEIGDQIPSLLKIPPANAAFQDLPAALMQAKNYAAFSKSFSDYLYQNQTFDLMEASEAKMVSQPEESEADFRNRVAEALKSKFQKEADVIRERYAGKIRTLQDRIQRAQGVADEQRAQVWRRILDTIISVGSTLLAAFLGRGVTKGSISQAGTSLKKAGRIGKEQEDVVRSEETLGSLQQQLKDNQSAMEQELAKLLNAADPQAIVINKTVIRPKKSDIDVDSVSLLWYPLG